MGEPPLFGDVAGGTGNGRPRKARRDPSGLASSASPSGPDPSVAPRHLPAQRGVTPKRGAFLRGRSPRGKPPHQGRWPRSRPEGFGKSAGGCPLMRGHGQLRAAYMPPLQSSDLKQRPSREQQPLKASGVRGRLAAHNERRQFAAQTRSCGCLPRRGKHCSLPSFAALNCGPTLATPQHPNFKTEEGSAALRTDSNTASV